MHVKRIIRVVCMQWKDILIYGLDGPFQLCLSLLLTVFSFFLVPSSSIVHLCPEPGFKEHYLLR